jgi:preprotein translocase subunit SecG
MIPFTIFLALIIIVSFLLILTIMVQNPKSGGLSSTLGSNQIGGVQKTTDFLEKATWVLSGTLVVLILFSGLGNNTGSGDSKFTDGDNTPIKTTTEKPATTAPAAKPTETKK